MNEERLRKLQEKITIPYFTTDSSELKYLVGYTGTFGGLYVDKNKFYFLTDSRYALQYKDVFKNNLITVKSSIIQGLFKILKKEKCNEICINSEKTTYKFIIELKKVIPNVKIKAADSLVSSIRTLKTKDEILLIKQAIKIAEDAFLYILSFLKEGISEKQTAIELEHAIKLKGGDDIAFPLIVLFGPRTAYPHGTPEHNVKLKYGDPVLIDMGVKYKNYNSDLTRTLCFGNIPEDFKDIYKIVLEAQKRAFEKIKHGINVNVIDSAARSYIADQGYGDFFGHGTGHGIGIDVHEAPRISFNCKEIIKIGMVFSDEPGIYIPGKFGIRIEDLAVCRQKGGEWLTTLPKDEIICL